MKLARIALAAELVVDLIVLGNHEDTARVAVEPMHDSGAKLAGDVAELIEVKLQRSRERAAIVALAGGCEITQNASSVAGAITNSQIV